MEFLKYLLEIYYNKLTKKKHDCLLLIVGKEGSSKSTVAKHILDLWQTKLNGECTEEDVKHISLNIKDFVNSLKASKKYNCYVLDEGGELGSRSAMSKMNKQLQKLYMHIRGRCMLTIICIPDLWSLDSYFVRHRARGLIHVTKRGKMSFYKRTQLEKIVLLNQSKLIKRINILKPLFKDDFPKYKGNLLEPYNKLKEEKMKQALKELTDGTSKDENKKKQQLKIDEERTKAYELYGSKKAAEMFDVTTQSIRYSVRRFKEAKAKAKQEYIYIGGDEDADQDKETST